jgi:hypothetical protein
MRSLLIVVVCASVLSATDNSPELAVAFYIYCEIHQLFIQLICTLRNCLPIQLEL